MTANHLQAVAVQARLEAKDQRLFCWFAKKKSLKSFEAVIRVTVCVKGSPLATLNLDGAEQFLDNGLYPFE